MTEEYKPIQDFENYEVSNLGNVRNKKTNKILKQRITKDGYLMVKLRNRQYVLKHKWMWESEHGKVPAGYALKFIDGNPLNCVLGNLRLISRAENMANNTIHNLPEDLKEVIRLKNKINRICDAKEQD